MKNSKKEYIVKYIDEFNLTISRVKSQKKQIKELYETLVKFQKKIMFTYLVTVEVHQLLHILVWI